MKCPAAREANFTQAWVITGLSMPVLDSRRPVSPHCVMATALHNHFYFRLHFLSYLAIGFQLLSHGLWLVTLMMNYWQCMN